MELFVACDLGTKNVEMSEFEAHYAQSLGMLSRFYCVNQK